MDYKETKRYKAFRAVYYSAGRICDQIHRIINKAGHKESFYYTPIGEPKIFFLDHELHKVKRFFEWCKKYLGLPNLRIEWVEIGTEEDYRIFGGAKSDKPLLGQADVGGNKIYIRTDFPLDDILRTIAHECHHHWFYRKYGKSEYWRDNEMLESTANGFAGKAMIEFREENTSGKIL